MLKWTLNGTEHEITDDVLNSDHLAPETVLALERISGHICDSKGEENFESRSRTRSLHKLGRTVAPRTDRSEVARRGNTVKPFLTER